jgi:DNA-binding response OmpR family regulator
MKTSLFRALIIDDDADLCALLTLILEEQNFEVEIVHTLGEAEKCLGHYIPSLIFLDHHLPDGYGIDFIPTIKSLDENANIVVITADPSGAMRQRALGEGSTYFLSKPFSTRSVYDVIDTILQQQSVKDNTSA